MLHDLAEMDDSLTKSVQPAKARRPADTDGGQHPLRLALLAQVLGALPAASIAFAVAPELLARPMVLAGLQGFFALLAAWGLRAPVWWLPIQLCFMPGVVLARGMELPSWLWLGGFLILLMVFWRTDKSRVPLYLSNSKSCEALLSLLPAMPCRVIDLGCGDGAVLRHLARARPDCSFVGIEHAPLPWAWARLAARGFANLRIIRGDFWSHPLADYSLVYVFLSPAAMPRLGARLDAQMCSGTRLVSNSFPLSDRAPQTVVDVADRCRTRLLVYDLPRAD